MKYLIIIVVIIMSIYLCTSFIMAQWSPFKWPMELRIVFVIVNVMLSAIVCGVIDLYNSKPNTY